MKHLRVQVGGAALVAALFVAAPASAQFYNISDVANTYSPLGSGSTSRFPTTSACSFGAPDDGATLVALPFSFDFYDVTATHVSLGVNGAMVFHTSNPGSAPCINFVNLAPNDGSANPAFIAPFWDDLFLVAGTSDIRTQTLGSAPNR